MYLFGGFNTTLMNDMMILDVEAMHWSSVPPDSVALPSPRRCHTLCASSGDDGKRLWLFGGTDGQKTVSYPTHKSPSISPSPCCRDGHLGHSLYVVGYCSTLLSLCPKVG
jgi:hypothetical protein